MKKNIVPALAAALLAACASAPEQPSAPAPKVAAEAAQPPCQATPKELVTKDVVRGEGRAVIARSSVMVNYTGWLFDGCKADLKGKQFDSSIGRNPFGFVVGAGRVIKGWDEGVAGMREKGAKRILIIPPDKAYGQKGAADVIPPNAALVFEVETLQIMTYPAAEPVK